MATLVQRFLFPAEAGINHSQKTDCGRKLRLAINYCSNFPTREVESVPGFVQVTFAYCNNTFEISMRVINAVVYRTARWVMLQSARICFARPLADGVVNVLR